MPVYGKLNFSILIFFVVLVKVVYGKCYGFHPVTCETRARHPIPHRRTMVGNPNTSGSSYVSSYITVPTNLCYNLTWVNFGWKFRLFAEYAASVNNAHLHGAAPDCDEVLILIDGDDVLINSLDGEELERRWIDFGADILISTEMSCWTDHTCGEEEWRKFYSRDVGRVSPYVNSALMGTVAALADVLTVSHTQLYNYTEDLNDQLAVTMIATMPFTTHGNWIIKRDFNETFFGTLMYTQMSMQHVRKNRRPCWFSCYDIDTQQHVFRGCCTQLSLDGNAQNQMFDVIAHTESDFACDVVRSQASDRYYSVAFKELEVRPLIWHGNGQSKDIFHSLKHRMMKCLNDSSISS